MSDTMNLLVNSICLCNLHTEGIAGKIMSEIRRFFMPENEFTHQGTPFLPGKSQDTAVVWLIGSGKVGKAFLKMLDPGRHFLRGVMNSRKMLINTGGIQNEKAAALLESTGSPSDLRVFLNKMAEDPARRKICVDCTASTEIAMRHREILSAGVHLVTANKIGLAGDYNYYRSLKAAYREMHVRYRYETTVGAALPVISAIRRLLSAGDRISRIEAVPSGTLSYLFNQLSVENPFSRVIRSARDKGYTEPDPRQDLQGMDAARKALIMARETGHGLEMQDAVPPQIISEGARRAADTETFLHMLEKDDDKWGKRMQELKEAGKRLRYIATVAKGGIRIGLRECTPEHPFYHLSGTENIFAIYSEQFAEASLVIRGAGAGAELTASGVLADLMEICECT